MINTTPERLKARNFFVGILVFWAVEMSCSVQLSKSFITPGPGFNIKPLNTGTPLNRYLQTLKTQMKCCRMEHFIRVHCLLRQKWHSGTEIRYYPKKNYLQPLNIYNGTFWLYCIKLFMLMLYIQVNNFSVMSGKFPEFLGWTRTEQRIKCLAHGHNTVPPLSLELATPQPEV